MKPHNSAYTQARTAWSAGQHVECGRLIYEELDPVQRVTWASNILRFCATQSPTAEPIDKVCDIANDRTRWQAAHEAFSHVRSLTLAAERVPAAFDPRLRSLLYVAENTAKVIYNASAAPAPFDHDAGWWLAPCLAHFLSTVGNPAITGLGMELLLSPCTRDKD